MSLYDKKIFNLVRVFRRLDMLGKDGLQYKRSIGIGLSLKNYWMNKG